MKRCDDCHRTEEEAGKLSVHRLCKDCAWNRQLEAQRQIKEKKGPIYEKWRDRIKASAE